MKKNVKRLLSAILAVSMLFGNYTPVYATEPESVVEDSPVESELPESQAVTFATTYTGDVEMQDWGRVLYIRYWEIINSGGTFDDATVLSILQNWITAGDDFEQVVIVYPNDPGKVSQNIWNAVAALMNNDEYSAGFLFDGGNYMDENWYIAGMETASSDVVLDAALNIGATGQYGNVSFKNTAIPARGAHVRFCTNHWNDGTNSGGKYDYGTMVNTFGTSNLPLDLVVNGTIEPNTSVRYEYYSTSPGNDNLDLCVDFINRLTANVRYDLYKKVYNGDVEVWDDGQKVLRINEWGFNNAGETFSETGVKTILNVRKSAGERFDRIFLTYPAGTTEVSSDVWNAAVELLSDKNNVQLTIGIERGSDGILQEWTFEKPETSTANISCSAKITIGAAGEYGTFSFKDNSQPAENVYVHFNISSYQNGFTAFADAFGKKDINLALANPSGIEERNARGYYSYGEQYENGQLVKFINLEVFKVNNLTADTTYKLSKKLYKGQNGRWDNNVTWLKIECWEFENSGETMTDAKILDILKERKAAGERFDRVEITYPNSYSKNIPSDIWNAAVDLMTSAEYRALVIGYTENSDDVNYELNFSKPEKVLTSVDCTAEFNIGQIGEYGSFRIANTDFPATAADLHFYTNSNRQGFNKVKDAFGDNSLQLEFSDPSGTVIHTVYGNYNYDKNQWDTDSFGNPIYGVDININLSEIQRLSSNVTYSIKKQVYRGDVWDWTDDEGTVHYEIEIDAGRTENGVLTDAEVLDILSNYQGMKFNSIIIEQKLPGNKITKLLFNSVLDYMEQPGLGRDTELMLEFPDDEGCIEWSIVNPSPLEEDQILTAAYTISAGNAPTLSVGSNDLKGDAVKLNVYYDNYTTKGTLTRSYFGEEWTEIKFSDTDFRGSYSPNTMSVGIHLWDATWMEPGKVYTISKYEYCGNKFVDEDGLRHLIISPFDMGVAPSVFTEDKVLQMLGKHESEKFDRIQIETLYSYSDEISAKIAEKATELLNDDGTLSFKFGFDDRHGEIVIHMFNPAEKPTYGQNVTVNVQCLLTDDNKPLVTVSGMKLDAESEYVRLYMGESYFGDNDILDIYNAALSAHGPNSMHPIGAENNDEADVIFFRNSDRGFGLEIYDKTGFDTNREYRLIPYSYRGNIWDDGSALNVSASGLGKTKFESGDLEEIFAYYCERGQKFDTIFIEEAFSSANTIKASVINLARELLTEGGGKQLCFVFFNESEIDGVRHYNAVKWSLVDPLKATKNINANVSYSAIEGKGLSVKLNSNTYNAGNVFVELVMDKSLEMTSTFLNGIGEFDRLIALKKGTDPAENIGLGMSGMDDADMNEIYVYIGEADLIAANTQYIITGAKEITDEIVVGKDTYVDTTYPVDADSKVVWTSHNTLVGNVAEDGTITAVNEGLPLYISASYKSNGKDEFELFYGYPVVKVTDIMFDSSEVNLIYNPSASEDENYYGIGVSYYPSNTGMDPAELIWTVDNIEGAPVELIKSERGEGEFVLDGCYVLKGAGKAIIKATHPEDASIYAEQIINVVELKTLPDSIYEEACEKTFVVTNFAKTLADAYHLPNGWEWVNPATDIKPFVGMDGYEFPAVYTDQDDYKFEANIWVRMVTVEALNLTYESGNIPTAVSVGKELVFGYNILYKNASEHDFDVLNALIGEEGSAFIKWSSNMEEIPGNEDGSRMLKPVKKGTSTVSIALVNAETGKNILTDSLKLKVYQNELADFDNLEFEVIYNDIDMTKGTMYFKVPADEYQKIKTITTSDKNVLTLYPKTLHVDELLFEEEGKIATCIDFSIGKPGYVQLIATADDEAKTKAIVYFCVEEKEPKILQNTIEINKAFYSDSAPIAISFADNYPSSDEGLGIKVSNAFAGDFAFELNEYKDGKAEGRIVLLNDSLKGNKKITLDIPVVMAENEVKVITQSLTVKISDKIPSIKITQSKNVNTFYLQSETNLEGCGILQINTGDLNVIGFDYAAEDFKVIFENGVYNLVCTETNMKDLNKKVTLILDLEDDTYGFIRVEKTITVKTESKAPSIVASAKSDTIYTKAYADHSRVSFTNKTTGEPLMIYQAVVKAANQQAILNADTMGNIVTSKNQFSMGIADNVIHFFMNDIDSAMNETVKFKINIQQENWSKPVVADYSIKVSTTVPKITLGSSKLTLNANESLHRQMAFSKLTFAGRNEGLDYGVFFVGMNEASAAVLNKGLSLDYDWGQGQICASLRINPNKEESVVKPGTYKYRVVVDFEGTFITKDLNIVVTNKTINKCFKISKKGTIDILRRGTTGITYTFSANGVSGKPVSAFISGKDANKFDSYTENGKLFVTAAQYETFSTKNQYKILLNITMKNADGSEYTIVGPEQSIKVTQGKPKVTILAREGNILYSQAGNDLKLQAKALLSGEKIKIKNVTVENYQDDLECWFDEDAQTIHLSRNDLKKITNNGKTWSVKFAVTFSDGTGTEKATVVTSKIIVK